MPSNAGILCIDFGTSSIRAALREGNPARPKVLELGEAFRSSIDRASIPSAIFIDALGSRISFGEEALKRGLRGEKSLLFEMSPKRWMTNDSPSMLDKKLFPSTELTRKHLLAGLLAQAFSATATSTGLSKSELLKIKTRVAHPVWSSGAQESLKKHLRLITEMGHHLLGITNQPISPNDLLKVINSSSRKTFAPYFFDVEEPVAAALQLFENSDNSREICVVIDVGAGTTDLGIFLSLTPDESSIGHRRKFIQAASPRSIYMAGDLIDEEVINLIRYRARNLNNDSLQDLQRRRRNIKETIFSRAKKVFEAGVEVTLGELEKQARIRRMQEELASSFIDLIREASSFVQPFVEASSHRVDCINVVFAGGGGNIGFLRQAIGKTAELTNRRSVPIVIRPATSVDRTLPAAIERLAVAMGGTTPEDDWPVTTLSGPRELITLWDRVRTTPPSVVDPRDSSWWREQD